MLMGSEVFMPIHEKPHVGGCRWARPHGRCSCRTRLGARCWCCSPARNVPRRSSRIPRLRRRPGHRVHLDPGKSRCRFRHRPQPGPALRHGL
jgi:hypothetical protein